jgi:hypothetical protein
MIILVNESDFRDVLSQNKAAIVITFIFQIINL